MFQALQGKWCIAAPLTLLLIHVHLAGCVNPIANSPTPLEQESGLAHVAGGVAALLRSWDLHALGKLTLKLQPPDDHTFSIHI